MGIERPGDTGRSIRGVNGDIVSPSPAAGIDTLALPQCSKITGKRRQVHSSDSVAKPGVPIGASRALESPRGRIIFTCDLNNQIQMILCPITRPKREIHDHILPKFFLSARTEKVSRGFETSWRSWPRNAT